MSTDSVTTATSTTSFLSSGGRSFVAGNLASELQNIKKARKKPRESVLDKN